MFGGWSLLGVIVGGCGESKEYPVAPVSGRVLCNGEPVPGGTVLFLPVNAPQLTGRPDGRPGKAGEGIVQPDGTFVVGTYSNSDGALIGPHKIVFEFPDIPVADFEWAELEQEDQEQAEALRRLSSLACGEKTDIEDFTVQAGQNELVINLVE